MSSAAGRATDIAVLERQLGQVVYKILRTGSTEELEAMRDAVVARLDEFQRG